MKLNVTGKQLDISIPFHQHVEDKLNSLSSKYHVEPVEVAVTVSHEHFNFQCELAAHLGRANHIRCHGNGANAYASFDKTFSAFERGLKRHKKRSQDHYRKRDVHSKEGAIFIGFPEVS